MSKGAYSLTIKRPFYFEEDQVMKRFVNAVKAGEIKRGEARRVYVMDTAITIFNAGGAFYATQDFCTGDGGALSKGTLFGTQIVCPADRARFYLPTGECTKPFTNLESLHTFRVRVEGDDITVEMEDYWKELHTTKLMEVVLPFQRTV